MDENKDIRAIKMIWKSEPVVEGAGVHLKRVFGFHQIRYHELCSLLDEDGSLLFRIDFHRNIKIRLVPMNGRL